MDDHELSENPTTESISQLTCDDAVAKLSMDFGGKRLYIPHKCGDHSPMAASIGIAQAKKICETYGGLYWSVPVNAGKRRRINNLHKEGHSAPNIARKLFCSERYVHKVLSESRHKNENQLTLL